MFRKTGTALDLVVEAVAVAWSVEIRGWALMMAKEATPGRRRADAPGTPVERSPRHPAV